MKLTSANIEIISDSVPAQVEHIPVRVNQLERGDPGRGHSVPGHGRVVLYRVCTPRRHPLKTTHIFRCDCQRSLNDV